MDIRNFFASKPKAKGKEKDDDDDFVVEKKNKRPKKMIEDSDSDSDIIAASPQVKKTKAASRTRESPRKRKAIETTPDDFFGNGGGGRAKKVAKSESNGKCTKNRIDSNEEKPKKSPKAESSQKPVSKPPEKKSKGSDTGAGGGERVKVKSRKSEDSLPSPPPTATVKKNGSEKQKSKSPSKYANASTKIEKQPDKPYEKAKTNNVGMAPAKPSKGEKEKPKVKVEKEASVTPSSSQNSSQGSSNSSSSSSVGDPASQLLVEKYKPTSTKAIIGQQGDKSNMRKLTLWLQNWSKHHAHGGKPPQRPPPWNAGSDNGAWAKCALLSGPPGVGKTTTAYLVSKDLGYDVMEMNASDARSKKLLEASISDAVSSQSLSRTSKNRVLLMDEVDGMAGNEDRGGMAELINLIKASKIPVICMCNDRNHQKIRSLANYCFDLRFQRPRAEQIKGAMMSICFKEKLKIAPDALMEIIAGCNQDVRQVLQCLTMYKASDDDSKVDAASAKKEAEKSKKTSIKVGPFDVVRKVFSASEHKGMSLFDKSDLFFQDYSLGPLFTQENYLLCKPKAAEDDKKATMELVSRAADCFCTGDLIDATIRSRQSWGLLPTQAIFSSVLPGEYMSGYMQGQIQFPSWFGKYSKQNKMNRLTQELQVHTRLSAGIPKCALLMDFLQPLREAIVAPMRMNGSEGVSESIEVMKQYSLLREDLDGLLEVTQWPDKALPMKDVDSKVKAAFTRQYNKEVVLPYATGGVSKKRGAAAGGEAEFNPGDGDETDDEEKEENDDITSDSMIKAKKPKGGSKNAAETTKAAGKGKGGKGGGGKKSKK